MSEFGKKLEEYRNRLDMTQQTLAVRIGRSNSYLNKIEKGTRPPPSAKTVRRMIAALRLTPEQAEELVQLAGYSPEVLKEEDEQTPSELQQKVADVLGITAEEVTNAPEPVIEWLKYTQRDGRKERQGNNTHQVPPAQPTTSPKASTGAGFGAGVGFGSVQSSQKHHQKDSEKAVLSEYTQNIGSLIDKEVSNAQLTPEKKVLARRLILESARTICRTLEEDQKNQEGSNDTFKH